MVTGVVYRHLPAAEGAQPVERSARGHLTLVCDGMYSNLRKHLSTPKVRLCRCDVHMVAWADPLCFIVKPGSCGFHA